jgi:hypothetical protein
MAHFRTKFVKLIAALCFFVFTGDLIADALCDLGCECVAEASHDGAPCCACAVHTGAALNSGALPLVAMCLTATGAAPVTEDSPPAGPPVAIDHPPQLS